MNSYTKENIPGSVLEAIEREWNNSTQEVIADIRNIEKIDEKPAGDMLYFITSEIADQFWVIEGATGTGFVCTDEETMKLNWN